MQTARIIQTANDLQFYSPYDRLLVADLKSRIPYNERRWDGNNKCWIVTPNNLTTLKVLCSKYLGNEPSIQGELISKQPLKPQTKLLNVRYIGTPKDRGNGEKSAFGHDGQDWSIVFPELVLKKWFEGNDATVDTTDLTLYGVLNLKRDCAGTDIKSAWRRMAKRYHPDVNKDDDAPQMMQRINEAYEVLNNPMKRKKYDAGLVLAASLNEKPRDRLSAFSNVWRPPERCGFILATGQYMLGRFVIETIHQWEPIKDGFGRELVTSWPMGADTYQENWV
jgi:DnaJ-domain-containing protein 1